MNVKSVYQFPIFSQKQEIITRDTDQRDYGIRTGYFENMLWKINFIPIIKTYIYLQHFSCFRTTAEHTTSYLTQPFTLPCFVYDVFLSLSFCSINLYLISLRNHIHICQFLEFQRVTSLAKPKFTGLFRDILHVRIFLKNNKSETFLIHRSCVIKSTRFALHTWTINLITCSDCIYTCKTMFQIIFCIPTCGS